jgi:hypothetical protein
VSEEKKLTDDEKLIKQIRYLADRYGTANCIRNPSKNFFIDTLDLIHRLQGENERLKINLANEKKWGKIQAKQAEKETAIEILGDIESCIEGMLDGERYMTKNEVEYLLEHILNKKQEYDVEVDYEN